jgi:hypothetical protein
MLPVKDVPPLQAFYRGAVDHVGRRLPNNGCHLVACVPGSAGDTERVRGFAAFRPTPALIGPRDIIRSAALRLYLPVGGYLSPLPRESIEGYLVPEEFNEVLLRGGQLTSHDFNALAMGNPVASGVATRGREGAPLDCMLTLEGIVAIEHRRLTGAVVIVGFRLPPGQQTETERRVFMQSGEPTGRLPEFCLSVSTL